MTGPAAPAVANFRVDGDLICIPGSDATMTPGHVGMYICDNYVLEAAQSGEVVKIIPTAIFGPVAAIRQYA